jgi:hypothetical protein
MGEGDLLMRFFFERSDDVFDLEDFGAFFDSEFPTTISCSLHFAQRSFLAGPVAVFLGRGVFCRPFFYFVEKQLPFDLVMRLSEVTGLFGRRLVAGSATSWRDERQGKRSH